MQRRPSTILAAAGVFLLAAMLVHLVLQTRPRQLAYQPREVMGTHCLLMAAGSRRRVDLKKALKAAEAELRRVEALMSVYLADSQLSRLNSAPSAEAVELAPELIGLLRRSRELTDRTRGAFDVTCLPIIRLRKAAAESNSDPDDQARGKALALAGWRHFRLAGDSVTKLEAKAGIDLGAVAKGYGVDRAVEALKQAGASGALVEVGGDIRCFGTTAWKEPWPVRLQSPFGEDLLLTLSLTDKAVATSGDYRRFTIVEGKRYSHVVDPRTARPVEGSSSVTVIADDATTADAWATALSVLGQGGLELAEAEGLEVLMILGPPDDCRVVLTPGFRRFVSEGWPVRAATAPAATDTRPGAGNSP